MTWQQILAAYMPALVLLGTVLLGAVSNNKRIDDLRSDWDKRFGDLQDRWEKRFESLEKRLEILEKSLMSEINNGFRRLEDRLERVEHPITRP